MFLYYILLAFVLIAAEVSFFILGMIKNKKRYWLAALILFLLLILSYFAFARFVTSM